MAIIQSLLTSYEKRLFAERIASTEIRTPPLFVLGHWRNGTTFLHNLLCQDPGHTYSCAYQALFPSSFLIPRIKKILSRYEKFIVLKTRPMDNVKYGLYEPWEDEFIIAANTGISPYIRLMFPRSQGREMGYNYPDFQNARELKRWKVSFILLLKRLTVIENKRLVLKSPPHTGRVKIILELFPEAKFIHLIRHPYDVFPSNLKLWRSAFARSFLQSVIQEEIVEIVLSTYEQVYERYHHEKSLIPKSNLIEIKFEDLERDPLSQLGRIYRSLNLPDFDVFASCVSRYLKQFGDFEKNVFEVSPATKKTVKKSWWQTFELYRYND